MKHMFLLPFIILSCSKDTTEKPVSQSVTYLRYEYGASGQLVKVDTSIHWCRVSGEDLARYQAVKRTNELICDTAVNMRLVLVIGEPCATGHKYKQATINHAQTPN
jgi:hypothetical protein